MTSSVKSSRKRKCYDDDDNKQVMTSQCHRKQQHQPHLLIYVGCATFFVIAFLGFLFVSHLHMSGVYYQQSTTEITEHHNGDLMEPVAMELKEEDNSNRKINNIHKRQIWVDKKDRKAEVGNLMYVKGSISYKEAFNECKQRGARLALLDDLERAYSLGYHNCKSGWLLDKHTGYVVQKDDPPNECKTTKSGVIYSSTTTKHRSYGAYCTYRKWFSPVNPQHKVEPRLNLWFRKDPADLYRLRKDLQKRATEGMLTSIRALYPCCNYLNIIAVENQVGKTVTMLHMIKRERSMRYLVKLSRNIFPESKPKIMPHIRMSFKAMYHHGAGSWNRSAVVEDIVSHAITSNVDGFMFDYEPNQEYTQKHAIMVRDFLHLLAEKMHENNLELGFCISDWGILKFYDVYADSNVDWFATMSVTYYGRDVAKTKVGVKKLLKAIDAERLQIGIKSSVREPKDPVTGEVPERSYKKPSKWTHHRLKNFIRWLSQYTNVTQLHVWPGSWGRRSRTKAFFFRTLRGFTNQGGNETTTTNTNTVKTKRTKLTKKTKTLKKKPKALKKVKALKKAKSLKKLQAPKKAKAPKKPKAPKKLKAPKNTKAPKKAKKKKKKKKKV